MKLITHKRNQVCFLGSIPVVVVNKWFDSTYKKVHLYKVKPLSRYFSNFYSVFHTANYTYEELKPTPFLIADIINTDTKEINLQPLIEAYPEHFI